MRYVLFLTLLNIAIPTIVLAQPGPIANKQQTTFVLSWSSPQSQQTEGNEPTAKQLSVNGTIIRYWEQGRGVPVVFVHGAISDHRYWESQRQPISRSYRYIAIDRRYFGTAPWSDNGINNSQATQVGDLATFIQEFKAGPVFLVGTSGGAQLSLLMTVKHPELVRGVFANEPGLRSILTNPADQSLVAEFDKRRVEAREKAKAGNMEEAARIFIDMAYGLPGTFDAEPPERKKMQVDNARTLTLAEGTPVQITCTQLGQLKVHVTLTKGELTKTPSKIMTEAVHRCIPNSRLITIRGVSHGAPWQNTSAFNEALLAFFAAAQ
jgi:pimeloyl-ACP methyl ester carboxylesterase